VTVLPKGAEGRGVAVGMSGGVDSAVTALLLREQGYRVVGVTLRLWSEPEVHDERACCSPESAERAKSVAHHLGIPHLVVDSVEEFRGKVVEYFIAEYARGHTPNPCAKCNSRLRFGLLLRVAHRLGLEAVATGHYARLLGEPGVLARGVDPVKDQSYVLAEVAPQTLGQCIFPLGCMTKPEVRAVAAQAGLAQRISPESQEICFVPDDDYRSFLRQRLGERTGAIVDVAGKPLGRHTGTYNFTIGQRKGLGIGFHEPLQVVALDADQALVIVGPPEAAKVGAVELADITFHQAVPAGPVTVQLRSQGRPLSARVEGERRVVLERPEGGVAPGQTAVVYDGDTVVLAGTIVSTES
jgi:tRNA-specific 2-thiouridylase